MGVSIDIVVLVLSVGRVGSSVVVGLTVRECVRHTFLIIKLNHICSVYSHMYRGI